MEGWASHQHHGRSSPQGHLLLPDILCAVFHYLSDTDRCRARLVCRAWDQVFRMADLWRERRTFRFTGRNAADVRRWCVFMECGLGSHLHHMEVVIETEIPSRGSSSTHDYRMALDVAHFLNMAQEQDIHLKSFAFLDAGKPHSLQLQHAYSDAVLDFHVEKMVRALCAFLNPQESVEKFHMSCGHFGGRHAIRVLQTLPGRCITEMDVDVSLVPSAGIVAVPEFVSAVGKLKALQEIGLNFVSLGNPVLARLVTSSSALHTIRLGVDIRQWSHIVHMADEDQLVTEAGWRAATKRNGNFKVVMSIRALFNLSDFYLVLVPGMPLAELTVCISNEFVQSIDCLVDHVTDHYAAHLETCELSWSSLVPTYPHGPRLAQLVNRCPRLEYLRLAIHLPVDIKVTINIQPNSMAGCDVSGESATPNIWAAWSKQSQ
nr:hypothetical protein BaRGS_004101 [Batillaria attramentaria]